MVELETRLGLERQRPSVQTGATQEQIDAQQTQIQRIRDIVESTRQNPPPPPQKRGGAGLLPPMGGRGWWRGARGAGGGAAPGGTVGPVRGGRWPGWSRPVA